MPELSEIQFPDRICDNSSTRHSKITSVELSNPSLAYIFKVETNMSFQKNSVLCEEETSLSFGASKERFSDEFYAPRWERSTYKCECYEKTREFPRRVARMQVPRSAGLHDLHCSFEKELPRRFRGMKTAREKAIHSMTD